MTQPQRAPLRPMPPPLIMARRGFFRRTPPAIFPAIMGLFGLGLGWRVASEVLGAPEAIADAVLGAVAVMFAFALLAYLAKPLRRARVVMEDLRVLPGRAGLSAMTLGVTLLAAAMVPMAPNFAFGLMIAGFLAHLVLVVLIGIVLWGGPADWRAVTPAFHLSFVGFILGPLAAIPLGFVDLSRIIFFVMIMVATLIWGASLVQLVKRVPPAPLRPLMAIHLAPASLFTIVASRLGYEGLSQGFAIFAVLIFLGLLISARWLIASGFSALWAAFTFPVAAFATAMMLVSRSLEGLAGPVSVLGGLVLVAASLGIPAITFRVMKGWASGKLAGATNAAEA
jgi:tellurite resistance protein